MIQTTSYRNGRNVEVKRRNKFFVLYVLLLTKLDMAS